MPGFSATSTPVSRPMRSSRANALHHLPGCWRPIALRGIARRLRPGGVLRLSEIMYSFEPDGADQAIAAGLATASGDPSRLNLIVHALPIMAVGAVSARRLLPAERGYVTKPSVSHGIDHRRLSDSYVLADHAGVRRLGLGAGGLA